MLYEPQEQRSRGCGPSRSRKKSFTSFVLLQSKQRTSFFRSSRRAFDVRKSATPNTIRTTNPPTAPPKKVGNQKGINESECLKLSPASKPSKKKPAAIKGRVENITTYCIAFGSRLSTPFPTHTFSPVLDVLIDPSVPDLRICFLLGMYVLTVCLLTVRPQYPSLSAVGVTEFAIFSHRKQSSCFALYHFETAYVLSPTRYLKELLLVFVRTILKALVELVDELSETFKR